MLKRLRSLALPILAGLLVASVGLAQTVRLQDATAPNLATIDSTGALKVTQSGTTSGTTGTQPVTAPASLVRALPNLYCEKVVAINQTGNTQAISGVANQQTYICGIVLISAAQQNLSVVEGTGATCGTNTAGLIGGATASVNVITNGGFSSISWGPWMRTVTAGDSVCVLQNAALNISGTITYHQE